MRVEKATSFFLPCPSCGKGMRQTGYSPLCEIVIYDFLCSDDGDRLLAGSTGIAASAR
jgi:hypothetical protein